LQSYPELVRAAECPVIDTSCGALLLLARLVRETGNKVVLTGEGSDEWMLGYPWYKAHKALSFLDAIPGVQVSDFVRRSFLRFHGMPIAPEEEVRRRVESVGGPSAWLDCFGLLSITKRYFYSERMWAATAAADPWANIGMDLEKARRWDPANREVWLAARVNMAGHLLQAKGDRVAMHSSVEVRYPFLDEEVFAYLAKLHPRWKLRGFDDKYVLRRLAARYLPKSVYSRKKVIFRAPFDSFHMDPEPAFVAELLSDESLAKSGYFDAKSVRKWRGEFRQLKTGSLPRLTVEMGLTAVVATQLWYHTYIDGSLCSLPSPAGSAPKVAAA
jgi:asparagine synthase (glutamine-hydrolysing)